MTTGQKARAWDKLESSMNNIKSDKASKVIHIVNANMILAMMKSVEVRIKKEKTIEQDI